MVSRATAEVMNGRYFTWNSFTIRVRQVPKMSSGWKALRNGHTCATWRHQDYSNPDNRQATNREMFNLPHWAVPYVWPGTVPSHRLAGASGICRDCYPVNTANSQLVKMYYNKIFMTCVSLFIIITILHSYHVRVNDDTFIYVQVLYSLMV